MLIHDEEDRSNPQVIEEYQSRLFASKYKWLVRLSTPTIPNFGIHLAYMRTNRMFWEIRCEGCGTRFEMQYPRNIEPHTGEELLALPEGKFARYKCHACDKTITDQVRGAGRWEPEVPSIAIHGYRISQMSAPYVSAEYVLKQESRQQYKQGFHNLILGEPFEEGMTAMTRDKILDRQNPEVVGAVEPMAFTSDRMTTMGVDVGKVLDVIVGRMENGKPHIIRIARIGGEGTEKWDQLDQMMMDYHVGVCVIDWQPDTDMVNAFSKRWPGRVWRNRYTTGKNAVETNWDEELRLVTIPREQILSESAKELLERRVLPRFDGSPEWEKFIQHHENAKKAPEFEKGLEKEGIISHYVWKATGNGEDHLFHASTYEMIARMGYRVNIEVPNLRIVSFKREDRASNLAAQSGSRISSDLLLPMPRSVKRRR
jgi:hypothetical protein